MTIAPLLEDGVGAAVDLPDVPAPPDVLEPVTIGPTWERDADGYFVLPVCGEHDCEAAFLTDPEYACGHRSLGWDAIAWAEENLGSPNGHGALELTAEQQRFIVWWYAIKADGTFVYDEGVLQRIKGWGKDPVLAVLCLIELCGPCRFAGWDDDGYPIAVQEPMAWVQVAATTRKQTQNTMKVFRALLPEGSALVAAEGIEVGVTQVKAAGGRTIESLFASARSLEGARATFVLMNETQHWLSSNEGHDMADVIERNATKGQNGENRSLAITNAYDPTEDSVAQRVREGYEALPVEHRTHILYDSLEAPDDALLHPLWIAKVLEVVRGDSVWLDIPRIARSILNPKNSTALSRRFWYNMITVTESALLTPKEVNGSSRPDLGVGLTYDLGMVTVNALPGEWVLFFDGSKSDDSTALVACRLSDGHCVTLGVWEKPKGELGDGWRVPRGEVDERVDAVHAALKIVAFFGDPSHTKTDDDDQRYWDGLIDAWHRRYGATYRRWAVANGEGKHSVMWDMASPERSAQFGAAVELFVDEIRSEDAATRVTHDGHPTLVRHMKNAQRYPIFAGGRRIVSMSKVSRESPRKIDAAVCCVGARMLRRVVLNAPAKDEKKPKTKRWM